MKKTIRGKEYNTETMTVVKKVTRSFYGDPAGYEETLYQAADGSYLLYTFGGKQSPYKEEKLVSLTKARLEAWQQENA